MTRFVLLSNMTNPNYLRLAVSKPGERARDIAQYACKGLDSFKTAIRDYLDAQGSPELFGAAISVPGWDRQGVVQLPNHGFSIDRQDMREFLQTQRVNLINDFVALALAVPRLEPNEYVKICGGDAIPEQVMAVIGPHTGLGISALAPDGLGGWTVMPTEGGHSDLAATNETEDAVLRFLVQKFGHVSRERVVSTSGLSNIWEALVHIDGSGEAIRGVEEIIALASAGDARARQCVDLSMGWFAAFASDAGLMLGARGGIYLTGELLDLLGDLFNVDAFVKRYTDKGRLSDFVSEIPVYRATVSDMPIIGLASLFE
ncbi:MAG: glucokinase [Asticcacaulis sp.]